MSFNKKYNNKTAALIKNKINDHLNNLQSKFLEFVIQFDEIKEYTASLAMIQPKQHQKKKEIM